MKINVWKAISLGLHRYDNISVPAASSARDLSMAMDGTYRRALGKSNLPQLRGHPQAKVNYRMQLIKSAIVKFLFKPSQSL